MENKTNSEKSLIFSIAKIEEKARKQQTKKAWQRRRICPSQTEGIAILISKTL